MEYVLPWIASMQYGFKIAPPNLIATVISLIGSSEYIIGIFILVKDKIIDVYVFEYKYDNWKTFI